MLDIGYDDISKGFLVKPFGDIDINITIRDNVIDTITAYTNNEITSIPSDILNLVKQEINDSL